MQLLRDPVVTLEDIRLRKITLSSLDLELSVRLDNPHLPGVTLRNSRCCAVRGQGGRLVQEREGGAPCLRIAGIRIFRRNSMGNKGSGRAGGGYPHPLLHFFFRESPRATRPDPAR
ncbi:MAG: hypothetical protein LUQ12_01415 [Methanoregulaceae archaeon]|nr:hypothetical protein [Methanoregulaceae archaeon]